MLRMATIITLITKQQLMIMSIVCLCVPFAVSGRQPYPRCKFGRIYQFGDSISDTGNIAKEIPSIPFAKLPYGEEFPGGPTGRCSNGFLIVDYIARAAGLPLLPPYQDTTADFSHGANFAVAGSTAMSPQALASKNIRSGMTGNSLDVQLEWMSSHLNSICSNRADCANKLRNALFLVGEIGGNDYNYAIFRKNMDEMKGMVADVVDAILNGVRRVISFGAKRIVVPGNFPIGCLPVYKAGFYTNNQTAYDRFRCLKHLNRFAAYHNQQLQQGIQRLIDQEHPNAIILYADYYNAYKYALRYSTLKGYETEKVCCGTGGGMCGVGAPVCANPDTYLSWDGVHMTQECYKLLAAWLIPELFGKLKCDF